MNECAGGGRSISGRGRGGERARGALACCVTVLAFLALVAAAPPGHPHTATSAPPDTGLHLPPGISPLPPPPAVPADLSKARKVREVTLLVRHRVFQNFAEQIVARLGESFPIGDTDYDATVDRYVPDFAMDIRTGHVISRTAVEKNPAFRIVVRDKGVVSDTTWALLDMPPHFARRSLLAFQVMRIDFVSGKPVVAKSEEPHAGAKK